MVSVAIIGADLPGKHGKIANPSKGIDIQHKCTQHAPMMLC
jgi:hypothetical protein